MTNRDAVSVTIRALMAEGRIREEDAAVVQMVESLAGSVDDDPANASLWREFRAGLETLRRLGEEDENDGDEISLIIAALRGDPKVRDAEDSGSVDSGAGGRKAGRSAR